MQTNLWAPDGAWPLQPRKSLLKMKPLFLFCLSMELVSETVRYIKDSVSASVQLGVSGTNHDKQALIQKPHCSDSTQLRRTGIILVSLQIQWFISVSFAQCFSSREDIIPGDLRSKAAVMQLLGRTNKKQMKAGDGRPGHKLIIHRPSTALQT